MGGLSSIQFFLDFWNFVNFAKPLGPFVSAIVRTFVSAIEHFGIIAVTYRDGTVVCACMTSWWHNRDVVG